MKKLFLFLVVNMLFISPLTSFAGITEMHNIEQMRAKREHPKKIELSKRPELKTKEDYRRFLADRMHSAEFAEFSDSEDLTAMNAVDIQHSQEYISQQQEEEKSTFEKMYDAAVASLSSKNNKIGGDITSKRSTKFYREINKTVKKEMEVASAPKMPTVGVQLPSGKKILVPAMEHIPYLMADIQILPTGIIQIEETVIIVANNQKLHNGLTRMLPSYSTSRSGTKHKINYELQNVSINGKDVNHRFVEIGNNVVIQPKDTYILTPGVYTYKFKYIMDRQLWEYDDFNEFYWNVTGSNWNLVVSKAGATVSYPGQKPSLTQNLLVGYSDELSPYRAKILRFDDNNLGFVSTNPLLIGEGMHILISLPKEDFVAPDFNKRFAWFIEDYGNNLFAMLGFIAILISYMLSWHYISHDKIKGAQSVKKHPAILRFLTTGKFDHLSFGGFLLDLYRRNIVDFEEKNKEISLIKKTDKMSNLTSAEKKALKQFFPKHFLSLSVGKQTALKLRRAFSICEKDTKRNIRIMYLQMNVSYLLFSVSMLLIAELAIAFNSVNAGQTFMILLSSDIMLAFYVWMFRSKIKKLWLNYLLKIFAIIAILFALVVMSVYIPLFATLMILAMIITIFAYSAIFTQRSGLIRAKIKEAMKYRTYLESNAKTICLGRDLLVHQANIFALDLGEHYRKAMCNKEYYRMDIVQKIVNFL